MSQDMACRIVVSVFCEVWRKWPILNKPNTVGAKKTLPPHPIESAEFVFLWKLLFDKGYKLLR